MVGGRGARRAWSFSLTHTPRTSSSISLIFCIVVMAGEECVEGVGQQRQKQERKASGGKPVVLCAARWGGAARAGSAAAWAEECRG